jgi:hypothetical protein
MSYVVTPDQYRDALAKIEDATGTAGRRSGRFGTGHLLFTRLDDSYDKALDAAALSLSQRYAMDFRRAAERYAARPNVTRRSANPSRSPAASAIFTMSVRATS